MLGILSTLLHILIKICQIKPMQLIHLTFFLGATTPKRKKSLDPEVLPTPVAKPTQKGNRFEKMIDFIPLFVSVTVC